jgi:hypothetical protein
MVDDAWMFSKPVLLAENSGHVSQVTPSVHPLVVHHINQAAYRQVGDRRLEPFVAKRTCHIGPGAQFAEHGGCIQR